MNKIFFLLQAWIRPLIILLHSSISASVSHGRVIVECCIGLLESKWRRLLQFSIEENTALIPHIILCACILHNICVDAGDVDFIEAQAQRSDIEKEVDRVA